MSPLNLVTKVRERKVRDLKLKKDLMSACRLKMKGAWSREYHWLLEAGRRPQLTTSKDTGASVLQLQETESYQQQERA